MAMNKKRFFISWAALTVFLMLFGLSCDNTKPEPPKIDYTLTLTHNAADDPIYADFGVTTTTFTATLLNKDGAPLAGRQLVFTWTKGSVTLIDNQTDSNGRMRATFNDEGYPSECTASEGDTCTEWAPVEVTVTYTDGYKNTASDTDDIIVLPLATKVANVTLIAGGSDVDHDLILVDDMDIERVYVVELMSYIRDDTNVPVQNVTVHYELDPEFTSVGAFSQASVLTDEAGVATITLSATGQELLLLDAEDIVKVSNRE